MEKLASLVSSKPSAALGPDQLIKLATTVDMFDRETRLVGKYTDNVPRPEDVIFKLTLKEARAGVNDACATTSGKIYDRTDFERIKVADIQALFGDKMVYEVSNGISVDPEKLAELASTLPRPDAETFDQLMAESGIRPIQVKEAALPHGFKRTDFLALANKY